MTFEDLQHQLSKGKLAASCCALCGGTPDHNVIFVPPEDLARRIGQPHGKQRVVLYGVCGRCKKTYGVDAVSEKIEDLITKKMQVQ